MVTDAVTVTPRTRTAWLLRQCRLRADDEDLTRLEPFAQRMRDLGVTCDPSRVSRWESGRILVSPAAVAGYERLLGIQPAHLSAVMSGIVRSFGNASQRRAARPPALTPEETQARLDESFENVEGGEPSGADWFTLAGLPASASDRIFLPTSMWERIANRLVDEMVRAVGGAYVTRLEALRHLVEHSHSRPHVMQAVGHRVADPHAQGLVDAIGLLAEVDSDKADRTLVRLLTHDRAAVRFGAAWALKRKLSAGSLTGSGQQLLEQQIGTMAGQSDSPALREEAADIGSWLPRQTRLRIRSAVRLRRLPLDVHGQGTTTPVDEEAQRSAAGAIAADVAHELGDELDDLAGQLIFEGLFHVAEERRHQANLLLAASPLRSPLARVVARVRAADPDGDTGTAAGGVLTYVVTPEQQPAMLPWLESEHLPLRASALSSLAHVPGWRSDRMLDLMRGETRARALYAAGMNQDPALEVLAGDADADAELRGVARWWLAHGGAVTDGWT